MTAVGVGGPVQQVAADHRLAQHHLYTRRLRWVGPVKEAAEAEDVQPGDWGHGLFRRGFEAVAAVVEHSVVEDCVVKTVGVLRAVPACSVETRERVCPLCAAVIIIVFVIVISTIITINFASLLSTLYHSIAGENPVTSVVWVRLHSSVKILHVLRPANSDVSF